MPPLQVQGDPDGAGAWQDAIVAAPTSDPLWVVTSPNATFIPAPSVGQVQVILRADYRYGMQDPVQWPQLLVVDFEYLSVVLRTSNDHDIVPIWWSPLVADFDVLEGSVIKCLGLLRGDRIAPLCRVVEQLSTTISSHPMNSDPRLARLDVAMRHARDRLIHFPCTWRDACLQVREVQRYWLMARAFLDYHALISRPGGNQAVKEQYIGAFTTDPSQVQKLYCAGIPIWWLRMDVSILADTRVRAVVMLTEPHEICQEIAVDAQVLYSGLVGSKHLACISRGGHTYRDISRYVLLAVEIDRGYHSPVSQKEYKSVLLGEGPRAAAASASSSSGRQPSRQQHKSSKTKTPYAKPHPSQVRGVNKFEPVTHQWMPPSLPPWQHAMANVDLSKPARPQSELWGYWIPEPGLLLRPQNPDRLHRYLFNWLPIRQAWLYVLRLRDARVSLVPTQWWRDFLYGDPGRTSGPSTTFNAQRIAQIKEVFGLAFQEAHFEPNTTSPVRWFDRTLSELDITLCPMIIWEVCELGFRYELLALDRLLVPGRDGNLGEEHRDEVLGQIFPNGSVYCVTELPKEGVGLSATLPRRRVPFLEAFRGVMGRWPRCPPSFYDPEHQITINMDDDIILARERELVGFYVLTFFEQSGRAPIIPHKVPA